MDLTKFNANWNYPTDIRQGLGRINELPDICRELNIHAPLLVTDPVLAKMDMIQLALLNCRNKKLRCELFSHITANPTSENINEGVATYKQGDHDGIIAFGGGSAIDAAKAIALMVGQKVAGQYPSIWNFEDINDNWTRVNTEGMAKTIAIPTTSGTGAEVGRVAVITDLKRQCKRLIFHPDIMPDIVILDAQLTVNLPKNLTAATGMDALSHALEAYCAPYYHPMAEGIAVEAIRLIKEFLPIAANDGQNLLARTQLMVASTMGATAFQKGLGAMHALAHTLGGLYNSHHGLLNAILMPYVLLANRSVIEQRIERLARYLELEDDSFDGFLNWVINLRLQLNIPHSLKEIGIGIEQEIIIGQRAFEDPSAAGNPIAFTPVQYSKLFKSAVNGELSITGQC